MGAYIDIEYKPGAGDPKDNLHWIQVVSDNHSIEGNHGDRENRVDVDPGARTPYYDDGDTADQRNFFDAPRRPDPENNHDWIAALFLVKGRDSVDKPVTIYTNSGILWGWTNIFFRDVDLLGFHDAVHENLLDDLPEEQYVLYHDEFHRELAAIPEPSALTLCAIGVLCLALYGWRRRK
ncbi:MAG: hypothetical protein NZT92_21930 [Abditibacteriales bacterium]|nr:hypothetical protein [Abditibacteriales bacterium]